MYSQVVQNSGLYLPFPALDHGPWVGGDDAIQTLGLEPTCCGKSCSLSKFGVATVPGIKKTCLK